jgi:acyl-CoA thioester hydrolase
MDAFGHVNNTVYFRYFEDARIAYFDKIGVHIAGRSTILGPKKLNMHYLVYSERFDAIAAEGEGLLVYYDYANGNSCEIPEVIVAAIKAIEA